MEAVRTVAITNSVTRAASWSNPSTARVATSTTRHREHVPLDVCTEPGRSTVSTSANRGSTASTTAPVGHSSAVADYPSVHNRDHSVAPLGNVLLVCRYDEGHVELTLQRGEQVHNAGAGAGI